MSFFSELKRRNVFKVAASYAIVAWIVLPFANLSGDEVQEYFRMD